MNTIQQRLAKRPTVFVPTVIRFIGDHVWLMNRREGGLASTGMRFESLDALRDSWCVRLGEEGEDEHSRYIEALPA